MKTLLLKFFAICLLLGGSLSLSRLAIGSESNHATPEENSANEPEQKKSLSAGLSKIEVNHAKPAAKEKKEHITPTSSTSLYALLGSFLAVLVVITLLYQYFNRSVGIPLNVKLVGGIISIVTVFIAVAFYGYKSSDSVGRDIAGVAIGYMPTIDDISQITELQLKQRIRFNKFLRTKEAQLMTEFQEFSLEVKELVDEGIKDINTAGKNPDIAIDEKQADTISDDYKKSLQIHAAYEKACLAVLETEEDSDKYNKQLKDCDSAAKEASEYLISFLERVKAYSDQAVTNAEQAQIDFKTMLIAAGLAGTGLGVLVLLMIWQSSIGLVNSVKVSADGVQGSSTSVSASAEQFKRNSEKLAAMTQEQAAGVQEIMSTLDEMSAMAAKNTEQTNLSAQRAKGCKEGALNGQKSVEEVTKAIRDISNDNANVMEQIKDSNRKISEISTIIEEISKKTNVINDIVFQTKLLSFNASVEAARAGEQGKGFAVVAEEVGNLAQMSGDASTEIRKMLSESISKVNSIVQESASKVERLIETSRSKVQAGLDRVEECNQIFADVVKDIAEVDGFIGEISTATKETSDGIDAISVALREIDTGTQEVAGVSQEAASASEELSREAANLQTNSSSLIQLVSGSNKKAA